LKKLTSAFGTVSVNVSGIVFLVAVVIIYFLVLLVYGDKDTKHSAHS